MAPHIMLVRRLLATSKQDTMTVLPEPKLLSPKQMLRTMRTKLRVAHEPTAARAKRQQGRIWMSASRRLEKTVSRRQRQASTSDSAIAMPSKWTSRACMSACSILKHLRWRTRSKAPTQMRHGLQQQSVGGAATGCVPMGPS
mmetsp:Transcript_86010/g.248316  ORF Transcript_86010/g.248316 Transcript_86010/m.248316 type:complete len:142 (-) Transcript_86010:1367-1792(-)